MRSQAPPLNFVRWWVSPLAGSLAAHPLGLGYQLGGWGWVTPSEGRTFQSSAGVGGVLQVEDRWHVRDGITEMSPLPASPCPGH